MTSSCPPSNSRQENSDFLLPASCSSSSSSSSTSCTSSSSFSQVSLSPSVFTPTQEIPTQIYALTTPISPSSPPSSPSTSSSHITLPFPSPSSSSPPSSSLSSSLPLKPRSLLSILLILLFGQFLSFLLTCTAVFAQFLANNNVNVPTTQSFINYFLLMVTVGPIFIYRRRRERRGKREKKSRDQSIVNVNHNEYHPINDNEYHLVHPSTFLHNSFTTFSSFLSLPFPHYLLLSLFDVEGNYFLVKSYQYTTITSIQLLDAGAIPMVMGLSYLIWRRKYKGIQYMGVVICMTGLSLLVLSDSYLNKNNTNNSSESSNPLLGDFLVLIGCLFYSLTNVWQEHIINIPQYDITEYLFMIGVGGSLVSALQMIILERDGIGEIIRQGNGVILSYFFGYGMALYLLYILFPSFLIRTSAVIYNLSILSSDFYSIISAFIFFSASSTSSWLYYICFVVIMGGVGMFHWGGRETEPKGKKGTERKEGNGEESERKAKGVEDNNHDYLPRTEEDNKGNDPIIHILSLGKESNSGRDHDDHYDNDNDNDAHQHPHPHPHHYHPPSSASSSSSIH